MRYRTITSAFALATGLSLSAQSQAAVDKASAHSNSCLMMSDSLVTVLGLSETQEALVKKADDRCLKACERVGYRTTGKLDEAAIQEHDAELKEILTTEQYDRWSALCGLGRSLGTTPTPMRY